MANDTAVKLYETICIKQRNDADLWPIKISHSTILRLNSIWNSSLLHNMKCPSWTQVKRQKRSNDQTENSKCINVTNRRSREDPCRLVNPISHWTLKMYQVEGTIWALVRTLSSKWTRIYISAKNVQTLQSSVFSRILLTRDYKDQWQHAIWWTSDITQDNLRTWVSAAWRPFRRSASQLADQ